MDEIKGTTAKEIGQCPFCKDSEREFVAFYPAFQDVSFERNAAEWHDINSDVFIDRLECKHCKREIPKEIWQKWF